MKNLIKIIVLSNFLISIAYANTSTSTSTNTNGIYFGIGGTSSKYKENIVISGTRYTLKYKSTSFKALVGKRLNDNVATELQFTNFTKDAITVDGVVTILDTSGNSFGVAGLYYFNSGEDFLPFVKLGFHSWDFKTTNTSTGVSSELDGTDIFYGIGVDGKINETMKYRVEFEKMDIDGDDMNNFGAVLLINL
ncbi:hypothetical protein MS2017_1870 [Bathymodiolus thermophilus thioautotrophic gill symbiont]|uniref:Outer membrane protein beta-barrel domain-containing protein n=1 Tax=Bathymodiolus thermophilus thioautotrophic gill symbiont TaxID=2360 RepID=A0A3G3INX2_9GAMM|nr:outer membrane beta-barrel protein [Bathymodiolus thermophilus thioautotrophic gill symbiont]AYQ57543.1 hypothetical protein MS2017_1870 [Bathymodiolus thermophilus thioautotrophic gill symbiont]CAB5499663.1 hypothetical protein THERMOS_1061 [Bathymodiolus thermophilus thioautotrophic gill symbiont]